MGNVISVLCYLNSLSLSSLTNAITLLLPFRRNAYLPNDIGAKFVEKYTTGNTRGWVNIEDFTNDACIVSSLESELQRDRIH